MRRNRTPAATSRIIRWIDYRLPFVAMLEHELHEYPTPRNLNYWWNFGSLAGIMLVIMIVTGIVLAMHYTPNAAMAFDSVERIMRDVNYGWLLRYIHMNGASMFFLDRLHPHVPRPLLRLVQVPARAVVDARRRHPAADDGDGVHGLRAALGPDELSGARRSSPICSRRSRCSATKIVTLLWGGFTVDNPTLNRFFSLHYLLPFVIVAVVGLHLVALHTHGSNNPLGIDRQGAAGFDPVPPVLHDQGHVRAVRVPDRLRGLRVLLPECARRPAELHPGEPAADPARHRARNGTSCRSTRSCARSRSTCSASRQADRRALMFSSILMLFVLPWLDTSPVRSATFRPIYKKIFWLLVIDVLMLGYVGAHPPAGIDRRSSARSRRSITSSISWS